MPNRAEHLRHRSGCGATDLGKLLGISRRQVQRLLAGKPPNLPTDTLLGRLLAMPDDAFRLYVLHVTGKTPKGRDPMTITLPEAGRRPLRHQYPQQSAPQPAYLWITPRGASWAWGAETGGAVPSDVWHGRTRRVPVDPNLTRDQLRALSVDVAPFVRRVRDGLSVTFDGRNHVGVLTDDALDALDHLTATLDAETPEDWDWDLDGDPT